MLNFTFKFAVSGKYQRGGHSALSLCFYLLTFLFMYFLSSNKCTFGVPNPVLNFAVQSKWGKGRRGGASEPFPFPPNQPTRPPKALIPHCHTFVWANCNLRWMDLLWFENYFVIYFFREYYHKYPNDIRLFIWVSIVQWLLGWQYSLWGKEQSIPPALNFLPHWRGQRQWQFIL